MKIRIAILAFAIAWCLFGLSTAHEVIGGMLEGRRPRTSAATVLRMWLVSVPYCIVLAMLLGPIGWYRPGDDDESD